MYATEQGNMGNQSYQENQDYNSTEISVGIFSPYTEDLRQCNYGQLYHLSLK